MDNEGTAPLLLAVREAARMIGVGETTAWGLISSGELSVVRVGRRTLVPRASIQQYVERLMAHAAERQQP